MSVLSRGTGGQISFRDWVGIGADEYAYVAPDPLDPNVVYGGRLTRWDRRTGQTQNVAPEPLRSGRYRTLRTAPVVFHRADPRLLLFATNVLWATRDGGATLVGDLARPLARAPGRAGEHRRLSHRRPRHDAPARRDLQRRRQPEGRPDDLGGHRRRPRPCDAQRRHNVDGRDAARHDRVGQSGADRRRAGRCEHGLYRGQRLPQGRPAAARLPHARRRAHLDGDQRRPRGPGERGARRPEAARACSSPGPSGRSTSPSTTARTGGRCARTSPPRPCATS